MCSCPAATRRGVSPACGRRRTCGWRRTPTCAVAGAAGAPGAPLRTGAPLRVVVHRRAQPHQGRRPAGGRRRRWPRATGAPVEFHLIGFAYRELLKQPKAALTVHGATRKATCRPAGMDQARPGVVSRPVARDLQLHAQCLPRGGPAAWWRRTSVVSGAPQRAPMELGAALGRARATVAGVLPRGARDPLLTAAAARPFVGRLPPTGRCV